MTPLAWLIVVGALLGGGLALLVAELRPGPPDLGAALDRLGAGRGSGMAVEPPARRAGAESATPRLDRLGGRLLDLPGLTLPHRELALLGRTPARFMAHKLLFALLGLLIPPYLVVFAALIGTGLSPVVPVIGSLGLAAALWFLPDLVVRSEAKAGRVEYLHGIAAYLELVALERAADCGPAEALVRAAAVGRSAVFRRITDALDRATLARQAPWDGLEALAGELGLTPLQDLADIMRISGTDGAAVYRTLRARARNLRAELLAEDLARANVDSERMVAPGSALVTLMTVLIAFPAVYQMFRGG
ncbi:hypothetical protein [Phaeacidiphilus oryzae]|uniref:hypothetical protein n=1 Tax=Phaeacidiphilus oryzae TaxID=348818 RepID=UPI000560B831|nr:hypothetical protein [Phaeacidiphilus oryzae]